MAAPKGYKKAAHRWDQFTQAEVTVWHKKEDDESTFIIEINEKLSPSLSLGEVQTLQDALRNDLDLNKPGSLY